MESNYIDQIHWVSPVNNFIEEYTSVIPTLFGRTVEHYRQINPDQIILAAKAPTDWKDVLFKIVVVVSHLTLIVPAIMYVGKAIMREVSPLQIITPVKSEPVFDNQDNELIYAFMKEISSLSSIGNANKKRLKKYMICG